ncbi:MAG: ADP-ribosylglycohydrolase family protein [Ilumatobacteraceae bacterium]
MNNTHFNSRTSNIGPDSQQRGIGALIGACVGDALGAPFEFGPSHAFSTRFPVALMGTATEMIGGGAFDWAPGEFTDDSQMMLALAESLLAHGALDLDDVWARFGAWGSGATYCGTTTAGALAHEDRHDAAAEVHRTWGRTASNGALMRTWAIALAYVGHDTSDVMTIARTQAELTHFDPLAGWSAAIGTELCRRAILGAHPLTQIDDVLAHVDEPHRAEFARVLSPEWEPLRAGDHSNGAATICLAQAVWALRHSTSFESAMRLAIDLGGDTDTVACVAGALAGAVYSVQGIPSRWLTVVHGSFTNPTGRSSYRYADLLDTARLLLGRRRASRTRLEQPAHPQLVDDEVPVYASDLGGAIECDGHFATVSLCLIDGRLDHHAVRRELYMRDEVGHDENVNLLAAVEDAVSTVDALLADGHRVLVHCHGGRSRTGLVLKAWAMRRYGFTEVEAHEWLEQRWYRYAPWNTTFTEFLRDTWEPTVRV